MDEGLRVNYAKTGDGLHIAYTARGEGPPDLVQVIGTTTHLRLSFEEPLIRSYCERLESFARVVNLDERGAGMSDPVPLAELPTLEDRMDDLLAVMDALQLECATLLGICDGGPLALLFAATYPERVSRLVCFNTYATLLSDVDYPFGISLDDAELLIASIPEMWGTGSIVNLAGPSVAPGPLRERWARYEASAASPGQAWAIARRSLRSDVRGVLAAITAPTLVIHRTGNRMQPVAMGRYVAEHIAGAKFVELPGVDSYPFTGDVDALVEEVEEFVTGQRSSYDADRLLATVLFTDIIDSTRTAAEVGDHRWSQLLNEHDALIHRQLERFRGRAVKSTGDGFLATFDGPVRAMRCACAIREGARRLGIEIRAGLHTGEIEVRGDDIAGIAVHLAARVVSLASPGEVLVSSAIPPLVAGCGITFVDRGEHTLKGVPGSWRLFAIEE